MNELKKTLKETLHGKYMKVVMAVCVMSALCVSAFAEETTTTGSMDGITASLTTAFTNTAGDILKIIGIAIVAVMSVVGVKVAVKSGIKFFKNMSSGS